MDKTRAVYGIDLGTTYSCIAQVDKFDQAIVLTNFEGNQTTPSVVYFESKDKTMVGSEAKGMLATEPHNCVSFVKRSMIRVMVLLPIPYRFWVVLYPMPPWRNSITPMIVE